MTTAAASMATMQPVGLDELQDGELLTMVRRAPFSSAMRDAAYEAPGTSQMHVFWPTPRRTGARVSARAWPNGSDR
jgi:hypothetical protein